MSNSERVRNAVTPASVLVAAIATLLWTATITNTDDSDNDGLVFLIYLPWLAVAGIAGSRPLWDKDFTVERRFGERGRHLFRKYYGLIGIATSTLSYVLIAIVADQLGTTDWYKIGFIAPVVMTGLVIFLIPRTPVRQIGAGLVVGIGVVPLFVVVLFLVVFLVPASAVYGLTAFLCWSSAKQVPVEQQLAD